MIEISGVEKVNHNILPLGMDCLKKTWMNSIEHPDWETKLIGDLTVVKTSPLLNLNCLTFHFGRRFKLKGRVATLYTPQKHFLGHLTEIHFQPPQVC